MQVYELPNETKAATGFTHKAIVTHVDLTESTADTDQTIALLSVVAGDVVEKAAFQLVTAVERRERRRLQRHQRQRWRRWRHRPLHCLN
jgi:hypothetical protein